MTASKALFYFCISFVAGIFFESLIKIPQFILWIFLFFGVLLIFLSFSIRGNPLLIRVNPLAISFCIFFLVLGVLRMHISEFNAANDELSKFNDKGEIVLTGIISVEPDIRDAYQKLKIKTGGSTVLITTNRYPEYRYLDKIKISGKLESPQNSGGTVIAGQAPSETKDFNYKNYLLKDHIYSVMYFPKVELISREHSYGAFLFVYEKILFLKQKIRESIRQNFLPPHSSILEGAVLGDNGAIPNDLKNKLNITGLRHIISVSGTHIVILSAILMSFLLFLGLSRGKAFYFAIILIFIYIILTGLPSSGIRAGIMGGLYLLAQKLGRQSMGVRVIAMACAAMLAINPLLLFYDVGFQLSFLAVLGLILIEPLVKNFLLKIWKMFLSLQIFRKKLGVKIYEKTENRAQNLLGMASTTFAAQIFTLPIMVYNFSNISFVSPLTNILILPIVSPLMILGFLSSLFGIFSNFLGWIFSVPCWFLLEYFIKVIDFFSQTWAQKTIQNVSWLWLAVFYFVLGFLIKYFRKKQRPF